MTVRIPLALSALALVAGLPLALGGAAPDPTRDAIRLALSADAEDHADGVERLRARGQDGLDALIDARERGSMRAPDARWTAAIDGVAAQRDAAWSGLFWHTDLHDAQQEAAERGVPIVSLRLLGDLRDELSCANSRFFRAILYTHPDVSETLREDFVLHWSSERDVPRITIDYGDGRVIESTVTGNSAHYILDERGRPIDVIPGLFAPEAFLLALEDSGRLHDRLGSDPSDRAAVLADHHGNRRDAAVVRVQRTTDVDYAQVLDLPAVDVPNGPRSGTPVPAQMAIPIAVGKGVWEGPTAEAFVLVDATPSDAITPDDLTVTESWAVHDRARALMEAQRAAGPDSDGAALDAMIARFGEDLARDTVWNRDVLHARVHDRFARGKALDFPTLNAWLYTDLFATPASDPWLGLWQPDVYLGLPNAGLR